MSQLKVSILGTGTIGTSLALALKANVATVEIVGHDREHARAGEARKMGALDRTSWNLHKAVEGADLIVLAMPLFEIRDTLMHISESARPDAVIMDVAELKKPVLAWAKELLPDTVHFIGSNPLVSVPSIGPSGATETLFKDKRFALVPSPTAKGEAIDLVSKVVQVVGAEPLFITADEHDSMIAAMHHMPALLALAYGQVVFGSPSWRDMREMTTASFNRATMLPTYDVEELYTLLLNNRAALRPWVRAVQEALTTLLDLLESDPVEAPDKHTHLRNLLGTLLKYQEQWESGVAVEEIERFDTAVRQAKDVFSIEQLLYGRFFRRRRKRRWDEE